MEKTQKKIVIDFFFDGPAVEKKIEKCENSGKAFIVGGSPADQREFPHMAYITTNQGGYCGGTLISEEYVLTAAHCFQKSEIMQ